MVQQILDDLRTYFEAKTTITPEEQALLQRLKDDFFPITSVSREDLQTYGFDTRSVTDAQMRRLVQKMANDYCEQLFWSSMEIIAEGLEFPRYPECPVCASRHVCLDGQKGTFRCEGCGQEWHEHLYVLVEFPDDTSFFEEEYIGYPSFGSSDNGARYVPNTIILPILRNNRSRTDISNRLAGRNHNYTFFKTSLTMISIV